MARCAPERVSLRRKKARRSGLLFFSSLGLGVFIGLAASVGTVPGDLQPGEGLPAHRAGVRDALVERRQRGGVWVGHFNRAQSEPA